MRSFVGAGASAGTPQLLQTPEPLQPRFSVAANFGVFVMHRAFEDLAGPGVVQDHKLVNGPNPGAQALRRGQLDANIGEPGPIRIENAFAGMAKAPHDLARVAVAGALQQQAHGGAQSPFSRDFAQRQIAVGNIQPVGFVIPGRIVLIRERGSRSSSAITSESGQFARSAAKSRISSKGRFPEGIRNSVAVGAGWPLWGGQLRRYSRIGKILSGKIFAFLDFTIRIILAARDEIAYIIRCKAV